MIIDKENNNIFIVEKLNSLKNKLNQDTINLESVKRDMQSISSYDNASNYAYLNSLLDPIRNKGVKIPSKMPIPSCNFQLHNYINFFTAENGLDIFTLNPFFLASQSALGKEVTFGETTCKIDIGAGMYFYAYITNQDGSSDIGTWYFPGDQMQMIPDVYAKYRLVSACCTLKYLGKIDEAKGIIGGGINYLKSDYLGTITKRPNNTKDQSRNPILKEFGNLELIRDSYYHTENLCLEGLKMLYFPLDNSFEEFKTVWDGTIMEAKELSGVQGVIWPGIRISETYFNPGFNWFVYTQGAPYDGQKNFRFDYYLNFECIPKPEFLNYIPISVNTITIDKQMLNKFLEEVRKKCITKVNSFNLINNI